ncbi:MAG: PAS domain S-box protein [Prolixibacteraceae bacterium]
MNEIGKTPVEFMAELSDLQDKFANLCAILGHDKEEYNLLAENFRQSELKYQTIFENVQDVFYRTDLKGIVQEISPSIKYFSDFIAEEIVGRPVYEIYYDPAERIQLLESLTQKGEVREYEIRLKTKGGELKYASINARLISNAEGKPDHIDGALRDITARKVAENATAEREKELNNAQKIAKMGSWKLDLLTGQGIWSENMFALLGLPNKEMEISFAAFLDLVHPDDKDLIELKMQKILHARAGVQFDFRHILPNGEIKWFQNNVVPLLKDGQVIELQGVNIDITESKQAENELIKAKEKAEASDRLKTAFINNISHEIRTPLNAIQGFAPMIIDPTFNLEDKQEFVRLLNFSIGRLVETVTNFMDISLITSGTVEVNLSKFSFELVRDEILQHFQESCIEKNLLLEFDIQDEIYAASITTDKGILLKILFHLLDNAVKFTSSGEITVGITQQESVYKFYVRDTGIGISADNFSSILKHFVQEDESNTRPFEGSGLGLSIANGLVSLLGGSIVVESVKEKGSIFSFSLPVL